MEVGAVVRSCPIDHKLPQFPHVFFMDNNRVQTCGDFVHEERLVGELVDVFADRSPKQVDVLGVDKFFEHDLYLIFLLSYLGVQELEHLLDHELEIVFFAFHYLYYFVNILGCALVDLLHYLRNDLHHTRNHLPLVNLQHELHPVQSSFGRHRSLLLGQSLLQQRHYLYDVYRLLLVNFVDTLLQDLVDIDGLSPHLLLLVGHQQQDRFQDLIEPLDHYLLEIQFLVWFGNSYLDLVPEKHKKELKPLKSLKFCIAGTFGFGDLDEDGDNLIDEVDTHVLLKTTVIELLFYGKLEVTKALVDIVLNFHVADHQQQVLEDFSHMHDQIQVQKLIDPADQIFSDLEVQRLYLGLYDTHKDSQVKFSIVVVLVEEVLHLFVHELTSRGYCLLGVVDAANNLLKNLVEKPHAVLLKQLNYVENLLKGQGSYLCLVIDQALEDSCDDGLLAFSSHF